MSNDTGPPVPDVEVILPCLNEASALPVVLGNLPKGYAAIVVDNGSSDGSAEVARELGAQVIHEARPGYGAAVHAGLEAATADILAIADADGSIDLAELPDMVAAVAANPALLVCGRRRVVGRGAWPWHARWGNAFLAWLIRRGAGVDVHDLAPVRVGRRQLMLDLDVQDRRCGYPLEVLMSAAKSGVSVSERDIAYRRRAAGSRSKISGTVRGTLTVAHDFLSVWLRLGPVGVRRGVSTPVGVRRGV